MAFANFKTATDPVNLETLGDAIASKLRAHPQLQVPRNLGSNRTDAKRALLKAIEDAGGKW